MSAELMADDQMMYVRSEGLPWHGLGNPVPNAATAEEAIVASGLNWNVGKFPVTVNVPNRRFRRALESNQSTEGIPEFLTSVSEEEFAIVRNTDLKILSSGLKGRYSMFQNHEMFGFLDEVAGPDRELRYHTAGSLKGGRVIWLLAKIRGVSEPVRGDAVHKFILLTSTHDGSGSLRAKFTTIRVVCWNTLSMAIAGDRGEGVSIRHVGDLSKRVEQAQQVLNLSVEASGKFDEVAGELVSKVISSATAKELIDLLIPVKEGASKAAKTRAANKQDVLMGLLNGGMGTHIPGVKGTAWGFLQAVTEFSSHHATYRDTSGKPGGRTAEENRLDALWFGQGQAMADEARALLARV